MSSAFVDAKIPLPQYLKLLTTGDVPVAKAMAAAGKIYKEYGSPSQVSALTDLKLKIAGIEDAGDRRLILSAFRRAGYSPKAARTLKRKKDDSSEKSPSPTRSAGPSSARMTDVEALIAPTKRRKVFKKNEFIPDDPSAEGSDLGSYDFNEVQDETILQRKHTVVNRAPVMTAWATIVAERLNFKREEALSIASVYTEMNAVSKGVSLGLYDKKKEQGLEASTRGAQPYVELMGRSPVYRTQDGQWRALSNSDPVPPMTAFGYISRSFRQNTPYIIGAMRLLSESYSPSELNSKAWNLYAEFRPEVDQWGKRSQLSCSKILSLRKTQAATGKDSSNATPTIQNIGSDDKAQPEVSAPLSLEI